jgi:surface protein
MNKEVINVQMEREFYDKVMANVQSGGGDTPSTPSRPKRTGHADVEGLKAIGWTDEDIAYYQEHGVNWNEEDDEYHKVTDDNKALYGVLTTSNISLYKERIVYLPKIDTSAKTNMNKMFNNFRSLVSIPQLDTSKVTDMSEMFSSCSSLVSIPQLDTSRVTDMSYMFSGCYPLASIPQLDTSRVTNMRSMFNYCCSLVSIPQLDTSKVKNVYQMFGGCYAFVSIPQLDTAKVTNMDKMFDDCYSLTHAYLKNAKQAYDLSDANLLSKESLLYLINNEAAESAITIKLASYAYTRLAEDADVVAALANHPNISLAK